MIWHILGVLATSYAILTALCVAFVIAVIAVCWASDKFIRPTQQRVVLPFAEVDQP